MFLTWTPLGRGASLIMETLTLYLRTSNPPLPIIGASHRQLEILIWQGQVREHFESHAQGTSFELVGKNSKRNYHIQITDISEEIHFNIYLNFLMSNFDTN